ncbi:hypothetical protein HMPREF1544_08578 [Mucor circinelloides 1006PhL]|uniref:Cdc23 domain-containing protein n=1 Tax=Mucor circinelloides f. circinelloides (strain 1006PhL) TaxID=1220926 RepID=S2JXR0_MUCC1|nr:hypothetical protein HMPREF1544_08578 [Mucor circinelloides 1006PhL]
MDQKANQLLEEIDLARCRAQWSTAIELSKKYKKMKPQDSVLDITICTEVDLIKLLKSTTDIEKRGWDIIHQHDSPQNIALLPAIDSKKVKHLISRLDFLNVDQNDQFSKILLARIYFESGQYDLALAALQNLALRVEDVETGYGLVLLVQARAIKGICLEKQDNYEAAIEAYQAAWQAVELQPQERGVMLSFWIEECLYRGCLLRLQLNHSVQETLAMMRAYVQLVSSHWSPHWRMFRRWVIFKFYAEYLVKTCQNDSFVASENNSLSDDAAAFDELATLMTLFRHLFTIITPHLSSKLQSQYGMSLSHIMMNSHDTIGWGEINHIRRVLQYLYQVKAVTFNNATISRYIFFTLLRLGSLEESKYALRAYLDLVGVPDFDQDILLDDVFMGSATEASDATHDPHEKDSATSISPPLTTTTKAISILRRLADLEVESIDSVVHVLLSGVYLYGHEEQNGKLAAYLSDMGLDLLVQSKHKAYWTEIYRARGCAYSLLASQCEDPDDRVSHHQAALTSLQNAVEHNRACWKSFYTLGLQQAYMRDTHAAIISIRRSIELNPQYASSWHLLSLLYSCKRTDHLSLATQTLELGLQVAEKQQSSWSLGAIPVYSWTKDEVNANDVFERAESLVSMRMSQLALLEAKDGPERVIDHYQELFALYSQLTQQLGLLETMSTPATPIEFTSSGISTSTTTNRPRRKSSISLIRRTSLTSIANSITGGGGGSSSSIKASGRPRSSSVESRSSVKPPSLARRAESDTDDFSDDSSASRQSSYSRRPKKQRQPTFKSAAQQQQEAAELKKRSLQLIDLGLARRIGTAAANPAKHNGSSRSFFTNESSQGAVSLASMLTPSYSMGSLRSNSVSSRSSSVLAGRNNVVTKDGLMVSTFHQHHQAFELRKKTRWHSLLVTLWLMSTKTFMKANLLEEANKALGEAEQLGLGDPNVWWHLGQLSIQVGDMLSQKKTQSLDDEKAIREMKQVATDSFEKALILDPDHVPSQIAKAGILTSDLALGLLEQITLGLGWDSSEAWYQYAQVKKEQGDYDRVKSCLLYALELHDTEPIRNLSVLPKFII